MSVKAKKQKKVLTPDEKKAKRKKRRKIAGIVIATLIGAVIIALCVCAGLNKLAVKANMELVNSFEKAVYDNQLVPEIADDGNYTFITDEDFNVMQLTDVHIGAGCLSKDNDAKALTACAEMIKAEKPDLVMVTGDIVFPVPFQTGTRDNKNSAVMFAQLMEQLGVYWCPVFGNHDTESYSKYTREEISALYASGEYPHCLLQPGPEDVDGYSNYVVNVKNSQGKITQSFIMLDTQSYVGERAIDGLILKYDKIHDNQIEWYKEQIAMLTQENGGETPKSLCFFHIPLVEYQDAWTEYSQNGYKDTDNVKLIYGKVGEINEMICCPEENCGLFDVAKELGSTQGFFCGHDHLNTYSIDYEGIRLTYANSIDYLAYFKIDKYGAQRGCTMIKVSPDGSFDCVPQSYYQEKYNSLDEKKQLDMGDYLFAE